jgi:ferric-dicitrate binding protein FerR (iron transport regulator)
MSHSEDRNLDFVLKHYKEGAFDTQKAIERFKDARGMRQQSSRRWNFAVIGFSAAAAVLLGVFLFIGRDADQWTEIAVASAQQTVVLPDGTSVTLAPGSALSYRMKGTREVKMQGKVFFDVARDESKPFEVDADEAFVRVLGTEFMVDVTDDSVAKVYVEEGRVLFARNSGAEGVILTEGMGATLADDARTPVVEEKADANSIAWQRGSFIFDQTPLAEVLDCLSEYYHVSFAATDLSKKLSGEFYADDLDLIIRLIESALDVTIIRK